MDSLHSAAVVRLDASFERQWQSEASKVLSVLKIHHAGCTDYEQIAPLPTARAVARLRSDLLTVAPRMADVIDSIRSRLDGSCAVFIPHLGLDAFVVDARARLVYAMAICLGTPTATDAKRVIWDVKSRSRDSSYFSTFSETDREAAFHTDTQYYPAPEKRFLLYTMEQANCGGGWSSLCDARALRHDIERSERWIADVLADRLLPFRVPSAFVTGDDRNEVQATLARVFATTPLIRYRRDTLAEGLRYFPSHADADTHRALDAFEERLMASPHTAEFFMPRDSMLVVDNHRALHARTSFQDPNRHLLRIRLRWEEQTQHLRETQVVSRRRDAAVPVRP